MRDVILCVLCVLLLDTNATATGLRGLGWSKRPIEMLRGFGRDKLAGMSDKAKQLGAGLLLAGIVTCSSVSCVAELEQIEDAQIDIIEIADQYLLAAENDTVSLQLSRPHHAPPPPIDWRAMALAVGAGTLFFVPLFLLISEDDFEYTLYGYWGPVSILVLTSGFVTWSVYYGQVYL